MLLRDRDLALLPALAELAQQRQDRAVEHGVEREVGEQPVEGGVRGRVVEPPDRVAQFDRHALHAVGADGGGSESASRAASAAETPVASSSRIRPTRRTSALE